MRLTISVRPPELRIIKSDRSHCNILCLTCRQSHIATESERTVLHLDRTARLSIIMIGQCDNRLDISIIRLRERKVCIKEYIIYSNSTVVRSEIYIIPDTYVAASYSRNPVPADTSMECRIIASDFSTVHVSTLSCLFLDDTRIVISVYSDSEGIGMARLHEIGNIEFSSRERALDSSRLLTIHKYICLPVDAIKVQHQSLACEISRDIEFIAIPEI